MFFRADNRAAVFIDYEYWYVSMKDRYRVRPDLDSWCRQIRGKYQVERLSFFGDFQHPSFSGEVARIRAVSNEIIETRWENRGQAVKDMSDVIMLDAIYRLAAKKKSPPSFVLFTGDGHFQPVVRYLVQDLRKNVEVYGVRTTMSRALRDAASASFEIPSEDDQLTACFRYIVADFDRIAQNHGNAFATYQSLVSRVSASNRIPREQVEMALGEMLDRGWLTKKKYRVAYGEPMINAILPEWDELIEAGLHNPG